MDAKYVPVGGILVEGIAVDIKRRFLCREDEDGSSIGVAA